MFDVSFKPSAKEFNFGFYLQYDIMYDILPCRSLSAKHLTYRQFGLCLLIFVCVSRKKTNRPFQELDEVAKRPITCMISMHLSERYVCFDSSVIFSQFS